MSSRFFLISVSLFSAVGLVFFAGCESDDPRLSAETQYLGGVYGSGPVASSAPVDNVSYWDGDGIDGKPSVKISLGRAARLFL